MKLPLELFSYQPRIKGVKLHLWLLFLSICMLTCQPKSSDGQHNATVPTTGSWKLICLGDGLTAGVGLTPDMAAYPAVLAGELSTPERSVRVVNAGLAGEQLRTAAERLPWMFQQRFDALLLAFGQSELDQKLSLDAWLADWTYLLEQVRAIDPGVPLYVAVLASASPSSSQLKEVQALSTRFDAQFISIDWTTWLDTPAHWHTVASKKQCTPAGHLWLAKVFTTQLQ